MASKNTVSLIGNLGRDPEIRTFPSGDIVANLSLATTDRWRDKDTGDLREHTEWHRIILNGKLAEVARDYMRKRMQLYVEGSLRTRKWTDQATGQDRYVTEIRADSVLMLGSRQDGQQRSSQAPEQNLQSSGQNQQRSPQAQAPAQNQPRGTQANAQNQGQGTQPAHMPPEPPMDNLPDYPPSAAPQYFQGLEDDIPA